MRNLNKTIKSRKRDELSKLSSGSVKNSSYQKIFIHLTIITLQNAQTHLRNSSANTRRIV